MSVKNNNRGTYFAFGTPIRTSNPTRGNVFFVCSETMAGDSAPVDDSSGYGDRPDRPFATIDYAINQCVANQGDEIHVLANHAEAVSTDAGIALDTAGVSLIGHGIGDQMPTITVATAAAANVSVTAADVKIHNIKFIGNLATLVSVLEIAGDSCEVSHCVFDEGAAGMITAITVGLANGDSDHTHIHDCKFYMDDPAATNVGDAAIEIVFDSDNITIEDNFIYGDFDDAGIYVPTAGDACDQLVIQRNYVENTNAGQMCIEVTTAGTMLGGAILDNRLVSNAYATFMEAHTLQCLGNLGTLGDKGGSFPVPLPANYNPILGYRAQAADANSPQGTVTNIFTVGGGRVLVTRIVGQVGTIVASASSVWKLTHNPTVGGSVDIATDLEMNAMNAGTIIQSQNDGTALVATDGQETVLAVAGEAINSLELDVGVVEWECGESQTGTAKWDLWYWPIEDGAYVTGS